MNPSQVAQKLRSIADRLDRSRSPDRARVASEVGRLVTALQGTTSQSYMVGLYGEPGSKIDHEDVAVTSKLEAPFREAGASHFSWMKGGCYMHVPKEGVSAVVQALKAAQDGGLGDDLKELLASWRHEYTLDDQGKPVVASTRKASSGYVVVYSDGGVLKHDGISDELPEGAYQVSAGVFELGSMADGGPVFISMSGNQYAPEDED